MTDSDSTSLSASIAEWRARWPEWGIAMAFVPAAQRARMQAWFALLQSLADAAWSEGDPTPGLAKLAWWQEELRGWTKGARRHPLGEALQKLDAPWDALAASLSGLPATREASEGGDADALKVFSSAILATEAALFDGAAPGDADAVANVASLRAWRALLQGDREAARDARHPPASMVTTRPRRLHDAIVRERLRLLANGAQPGRAAPLRLLLASWRAARR